MSIESTFIGLMQGVVMTLQDEGGLIDMRRALNSSGQFPALIEATQAKFFLA